jgi:hypothetical protein
MKKVLILIAIMFIAISVSIHETYAYVGFGSQFMPEGVTITTNSVADTRLWQTVEEGYHVFDMDGAGTFSNGLFLSDDIIDITSTNPIYKTLLIGYDDFYLTFDIYMKTIQMEIEYISLNDVYNLSIEHYDGVNSKYFTFIMNDAYLLIKDENESALISSAYAQGFNNGVLSGRAGGVLEGYDNGYEAGMSDMLFMVYENGVEGFSYAPTMKDEGSYSFGLGKIEGARIAGNAEIDLLNAIPIILGAFFGLFMTVGTYELMGLSIILVLGISLVLVGVLLVLKLIFGGAK